MQKYFISGICGCLLSIGLFAQTSEIDRVLHKVEQNNKNLKAFQSFLENKELGYKTGNNLPDPRISAFYLPFGTGTTNEDPGTNNYSEFQISQSFEFPTVYAARNKWIDKKEKGLQLEYAKLRQKILLTAKKYCLELISLRKRKEVEVHRMQQARQVFDQIQELNEKGQEGALALNKAKIAWMQDQFAVEQLEKEIRNTVLSLEKLNGGQQVTFNQNIFIRDHNIAPFDSIWQEKTTHDPTFKKLQSNETTAAQRIKLEKNKVLPNLTVGFNQQGTKKQNFSGIYGGLSIPLWSSKNKVKAAEVKHQYQQVYKEAKTTGLHSIIQKQYNQFQIKFRKYQEYQSTLDELKSEDLLLEAYQLGEISFIEYYMELQFYRKANDKMLQMEKELYKLKAKLLKHHL